MPVAKGQMQISACAHHETTGRRTMFGWLISLGLIAVVGGTLGFVGVQAAVPLRAISVVFSVLFVICAVGQIARRPTQ